MIADEFWASDKNAALWAKMGNYIEDWGVSSSGRMMSWKEGNLETNQKFSLGILSLKIQPLLKLQTIKLLMNLKKSLKIV